MVEWPLRSLGEGAGALEFAAILAPFVLALWFAWRTRAPRDAAEFDGRGAQLSPWSAGFSLAASDLALPAALIALPLAAAAPRGGLVCLQGIVIGGLLGRWIVSRWILPSSFAAGGRGALDVVEERLGRAAATLVGALFSLGALLATAGRVFLFAFALHVSIGASLPGGGALGGWAGFGLITLGVWAVALGLYLVRGLRGSVAADGFLLLVLFAAVAAALVGLVAQLGRAAHLDGGWGLFFEVLRGSRKHIPFDFATSPGFEHTFWTALFLSSLASAAHYGADPLQRTRLLATGSLARARKALWISLVGVLPALGLCLLGAGLLAWMERNFLDEAAASVVTVLAEARWPAFVAQNLPPWARALALAGCAVSAVVAAKSALAALLQVALARRRSRGAADPGLGGVRLLAAAWSAALLAVGLALGPWIAAQPSLLSGLRTCGASALGVLAAAGALVLLRRPPRAEGLFWAVPLSLAAVLVIARRGVGMESALAFFAGGYFLAWTGWRFLPDWFGYRRRAGALVELAALGAALGLLVWSAHLGLTPIERHFRYDPEWVWLPLSTAWYVPTGGWIGFVFGCLLARGSAGSEGIAQSSAR